MGVANQRVAAEQGRALAYSPLATFAGAAATSLILLWTLDRRGVRLPWRWAPREAAPVFARARHLVGFTLLGLLLFNFDLIYQTPPPAAKVASGE